MTTYGDNVAGWLVTGAPGGMWAFLLLMLAVITFVAVTAILVRIVRAATDAV